MYTWLTRWASIDHLASYEFNHHSSSIQALTCSLRSRLMSRIEMNSHWSVKSFRSDHFYHLTQIISSSTAMSRSTIFINSMNVSNSSSSLLSSDLSDFEKQFDNDLDLDKAVKKTLNKYVIYRLTQYTLLDSVDYDLWIFIQADFADFIEKHLNQLNESIWKNLLDYCYSHDYWIDHDSLRKCFTNFLKILNVNSEYSNSWIANQIRWVKYSYKKLSSNTRQRKHEIMRIINIIIQSKIITENTETIIKIESTITAYSHSQAAQSQDARFRFLQSSSNQQISQNDQISSRSLSREFHYSQISKSQTSIQISRYFVDSSSVNYEHSSKQSSSSSSSSSSFSSSSIQSISRFYQINQSENDFFRQLALLNKIYKKKDKFSDTDSNFDYKVMIFYDKCKRASLFSHAYIQDVLIMLSSQALIHYYSNQLQLSNDFFDFCINIKNAFEEFEWQRRNLIKWQIISISNVVAVNQSQNLSLSECFQKMCLEMNVIQKEFDLAFYDSIHLRENIIRVCRSHFALMNDLNNASINVSDLINSLHISIINYEVVQKSAQFETYLQSNSFNQNQDDQYFIDRQYRREEYSNRRDEFRSEDKDKFRISRSSKKCFVCDKHDCWSINHFEKKRDDSKKRFSDRHSEYKIRSEYDRRLKQYIADFEEIIDDSDDEDATQYFDDLSSISSVIDDAKLIEFESDELFLTSLSELQNIEFVNSSLVISSLANSFINSLANKAFEHRLILKNIINILINEFFDFTFILISIIESRYDDREFKSILMNCDAARRSTAEIEQFTALQQLNDSIQLNKSIVESKIQFDIDSISIMSTIELNISLEQLIFHIIEVNTSFLLCLVDLNRLEVYFNNLINELVQKRLIIINIQISMKNLSFIIFIQTDMKIINHSIIRRYEHAFLLWKILNQYQSLIVEFLNENFCYLIEIELRRLHRRFDHFSARRLH